MGHSFLPGGIPRILVVDDDEVIRMLVRQVLESEGYLVTEAEDGKTALDILAKTPHDLVIMDIAMPGLDGPDVCRTIRDRIDNPPPILMITAIDDEETVNRSFAAGAVDYIAKPIRWPVFKNRIRFIIGSHRSQLERDLLARNYEMILDAAANGICGIDAHQQITYINPAGLQMLGYERQEVVGKRYQEIFHLSRSDTEEFEVDGCPFFENAADRSPFHTDAARLLRKDGTSFSADWRATPIIRQDRLLGAVLVFQDITERQRAAELIRYMANHDSLTSLPNRNYFRKRLPQAISLAKRYNRLLCLLFIDLDRFKPVNDTYGHEVGDKVLLQVARRLTRMLRKSDSVCRLGGDEFVILLESTDTVAGAEHVARRAIEMLNVPISVDGHLCSIGASIGISVFPNDCSDADTMLRHADIAMYQAKKKGRNRYQLFQEETV